MRTYERLADDKCDQRRTIADALEVFRSVPGFTELSRAEIRVTKLRLPSDDIVGLIELEFTADERDAVYLVSLPSATEFQARQQGNWYHSDDIAELNGAIVDPAGTVVLRNGRILHAVEVLPTTSLNQPTELDWLIVHHTISMIEGAHERCYRSLRDQDGLDPMLREMTPDFRFLDCNAIAGLAVPRLKDIAYSISKLYPDLKKLSPAKVSDALEKFGVRIPPPRMRKDGRESATI